MVVFLWSGFGCLCVMDGYVLCGLRGVGAWRCGLDKVGVMVMVTGWVWLQGQVGDGGGAGGTARTDTRLRECRRRSCVLSDQTSRVLS